MNNKHTNSRRYFTQPIRKVQYAGSEMKHIFTRKLDEKTFLGRLGIKIVFFLYSWRNIYEDLNEKDVEGRGVG